MVMKTITITAPEGYEINQELYEKEKRIEFKKISDLPEKPEDLGEIKGWYLSTYNVMNFYKYEYKGDQNNNIWPSEQLARSAQALPILCQLRDRYNGDWKPDWEDHTPKFTIYAYRHKLSTDNGAGFYRVMHFKSEELRDKFYDNFKDLLEQAKYLL